MKVLVIGAHADDPALALAGKIRNHIMFGDEVRVIACHDSRTAYCAVHQCEERPSLADLGAAVRREFAESMAILGVDNYEILNLPGEEGRPSQNVEVLAQLLVWEVIGINTVVYYHMPDAHPDHRAVAEAVKLAIRLRFKVSFDPDEFSMTRLFQFMIWNAELAKLQGQANMDPTQAPAIPNNAIRYTLTDAEIAIKRQAINCFKSQVESHPYADWDPQPHAVLNEQFISYFLRGEELLIPT